MVGARQISQCVVRLFCEPLPSLACVLGHLLAEIKPDCLCWLVLLIHTASALEILDPCYSASLALVAVFISLRSHTSKSILEASALQSPNFLPCAFILGDLSTKATNEAHQSDRCGLAHRFGVAGSAREPVGPQGRKPRLYHLDD